MLIGFLNCQSCTCSHGDTYRNIRDLFLSDFHQLNIWIMFVTLCRLMTNSNTIYFEERLSFVVLISYRNKYANYFDPASTAIFALIASAYRSSTSSSSSFEYFDPSFLFSLSQFSFSFAFSSIAFRSSNTKFTFS